MSERDDDRVKARLLEVTLSCLEHARKVRFGTGRAAYETTDGDRRLLITVEVTGIATNKVTT